MKSKLPILTGLTMLTLGFALHGKLPRAPAAGEPQDPSDGAPASASDQRRPAEPTDRTAAHDPAEPSADDLVRSAVGALRRPATITARIRHRINLFGQQLVGSGRYYQHGAGLQARVRMELRIGLSDGDTNFVQVCDGRYVWTHTEFGERPRLSRLSVEAIRQALVERGDVYHPAQAGAADQLALGGLPRLLKALSENFHFQRSDAAAAPAEHVVVVGRWKPARLATLAATFNVESSGEGPPDFAEFPPHLPEAVALWLGPKDRFVYRIEYLRRPNDAQDPAVRSSEPVPVVTLELFDVRFGADIAARQFRYKPGNLEFIDETEAYLKRLGATGP